MRRDQRIHWILSTAGVLCLAVGVFGVSQLAILAIPLLLTGAASHRRWHRRYGALSAQVGIELMDSRTPSRPGLYDRYDGVITSLMLWED